MVRPLGFFDLVRRAKENGDYPEECHFLRLDNLDLARGIVTVNTTRVYDADGTVAEDLGDLDGIRKLLGVVLAIAGMKLLFP